MDVEDIIRRVRNGEAFVIFCEPLAEHHHNLLKLRLYLSTLSDANKSILM